MQERDILDRGGLESRRETEREMDYRKEEREMGLK